MRRTSEVSLASETDDVDVEDHGRQDRRAENHVEGESVDADKREAIIEDPKHGRANQPSNDGARAAGERRAADHRSGDSEEHDLVAARLRIDGRYPEAFQDAGETGKQRSNHEVAEFQAFHLNTGFARTKLIRARRDGDRKSTL